MQPDMILYIASLVSLLILVTVTDRFFAILRDLPSDMPITRKKGRRRRSYSLARVQMAFWTIIVLASIFYLCVKSGGSIPPMDSNLAVLMGISGATGIAAMAVDVNKDRTVAGATADFAGTASGLQALDSQITASLIPRSGRGASKPDDMLVAKLSADRAVQVGDLAQHDAVVQRSQRDVTSDGFIADMLTDQNGNSLHRLQMVLFTVLFGGYVIFHVATADLGKTAPLKPLLDAQALALMGVAGGLYAGFKVPGKAT
jgi:hypothetical protein